MALRTSGMARTSGTPRTPRTIKSLPRIDSLVLSGGGVRGVAMLGAVSKLKSVGLLDHVDMVVGTSAGSILGALVATQRDLQASLGIMCTHGYFPDFDFTRLFTEYGLDSGKSIDSLVKALIPDSITFEEVHRRHGVRFVVVATNLATRRPEYFGPDTHADMPVALAIRMSCSIPLYFKAVRYNGGVYVDGSVTNNLAVNWAHSQGCRQVMGVTLRPRSSPIKSLDGFLGALVESSTMSQPWKRAHVQVLELDAPGVSSFNFAASKRTLQSLFDAGTRQAELFVKKTA